MESTGSQPALLSQKEAFARIRLLRSPHIGPITYRQLLARFGTAEQSLEALPELGARASAAIQQHLSSGLSAKSMLCGGQARNTFSTTSRTIHRC